MKKKDINPLDSNGNAHGYQEWYHANDKLWLRGVWKHELEIGYEEDHRLHSESNTNFYIR